MTSRFKQPHYINQALLDLCEGQRCFLKVPGICNCTPETVSPCHSPDYERMHGKFKGVKAHDIFSVPGGQACHDFIDGRSAKGRDTHPKIRQEIFNRAHANWLLHLLRKGHLQFNKKGKEI